MDYNRLTDAGEKPKRLSLRDLLSSICSAGALQEISLTAEDRLHILKPITEGIRLHVEQYHGGGHDLASLMVSKEASDSLINAAVAERAWGEEKLALAEKFAKQALKRQVNYIRAYPVLKSVEIYRAELEAEISNGMRR